MEWTGPYAFDAEAVATVPQKPGIYVLVGGRGAVTYVGTAEDLRQRLLVRLNDGRIPARRFRFAVVTDAGERARIEHQLIEQNMPRYNAAL